MMRRRNRLLLLLSAAMLLGAPLLRAQSPPPLASPAPTTPSNAEFLRAADDVLGEMSAILHLPPKWPLKKTIRTREEIRAYVLKEFQEDKEPEKREADRKTLEKFGLIPRGFNLDGFLVDLLTEQIAGLYDPKGREFFIADWIPASQQRLVMSHELTHALQDQHFGLDQWADAAKPNDDAELARHSVLEGSAFAAMMDWQFREEGTSVRALPDIGPTLQNMMNQESEKSSEFGKAPPFLRDLLLFPYLSGAVFTQQVLKTGAGWEDFQKVFANPPASTQQILHPKLYLQGVVRPAVSLPKLSAALPDWKKLDENVGGEFFLHALLKQYAGGPRADELAPAWAGDRYATFENTKTKQLLIVYRLHLESEEDAAQMFGGISQALEKRYDQRSNLLRRPNYFQFETPEGTVFLRCLGGDCLLVDGTSRENYDAITRALGWPAAPGAAGKDEKEKIARVRQLPAPVVLTAAQ
jgi:hypothetical protein